MCKLPCPSLYEMNKVLLFGFAVIIDGKAGSDGLAPLTERGGAIGTLADDLRYRSAVPWRLREYAILFHIPLYLRMIGFPFLFV